MSGNTESKLEGGCACGTLRYKLTSKPMFVHCCHCYWCQRESGSAFALNAMIEADRVQLLQGQPELIDTPSNSGRGQKFSRCPSCHIAVWSNYAGAGDTLHFVRVGSLDNPGQILPDIHIYTASKQPWVLIPENLPSVPGYYDYRQYWPEQSQERLQALRNNRG